MCQVDLIDTYSDEDRNVADVLIAHGIAAPTADTEVSTLIKLINS